MKLPAVTLADSTTLHVDVIYTGGPRGTAAIAARLKFLPPAIDRRSSSASPMASARSHSLQSALVFGFPLVPACRIAVAECTAFLRREPGMESVTLVAYSVGDEAALRKAIADHAWTP